MDFTLAILALIIASPLLILTALVIRLDSPGPAIFRQTRIGTKRVINNGETEWIITTFPCFKFRTMVCDADPCLHKDYIKDLIANEIKGEEKPDNTDQILKLEHDPRMTKVGAFIRKYSIDEILQFWNVVRGEMSVVGPRPAIPYEVEMYKPWYFVRFKTKPGITGWWQVTDRNLTDFDGMVKLDIEYVQRQSTWMDIKIMLKTPLAMISGKGAV